MKLHEWNARLHGLVIFRSLLSDPVAARFAALIDCLTAGNNSIGSVCNAVAQFESVLLLGQSKIHRYILLTGLFHLPELPGANKFLPAAFPRSGETFIRIYSWSTGVLVRSAL